MAKLRIQIAAKTQNIPNSMHVISYKNVNVKQYNKNDILSRLQQTG